ncbi:MAG TPA: pilus assembly protein TadG-related protein [Caulobacteraceae bacterium]|nr:pilus assembly protein TadG-related protein [Caulobacteraceae bacterium]
MQILQRFGQSVSGGLSTLFAVLVPALALLVGGTIELASLNAEHSAMQDAADATSLAMAKQLNVATYAGIESRAASYAADELGELASRDNVRVKTQVDTQQNSVTVTLTGHRPSFFGSLLPPGGWTIITSSTAQAVGEIPLCVLSYGGAGGENINMGAGAQMTASQCLVQSNGDINAPKPALLTAGLAQAVGKANGNIVPQAQVGAPAISDPFGSMSVTIPPNQCSPYNTTYIGSANTLAPGVHCGNFLVTTGGKLTLLPGEHYFLQGQLQLQGSAALSGQDVVLIFDRGSHFNFTGTSQVDLTGRTSGTYAGFVVATTRQNTGVFNISSTSAEKIEGTIYIPAATLNVQGYGNKVAQQSAWTVVVAQAITLGGSANLVINSNYATSSVPVPSGVGLNHIDTSVRLQK